MNVNGKYIIRGDITCDQKIDIEDLIAIHSQQLEISTLTGDALIAADTNGDGEIDLIDIANIQKHILGVSMLTALVEKGAQ